MKRVRLTLDAGGREAEIHPMYDLLVNAPYVERATAMHWNYSGDELGIMHYVEGDATEFRSDVERVPEVIDYDLTVGGGDDFYVYIRDTTNEPVRELLDLLERSPVVAIPPVEYRADGTVSYSVFGPSAEITGIIDRIPDSIEVVVEEIGGLAGVPGELDSTLSDRQREAIEAAFELGYYEIPREADHEDVARALDCAPSTAAEHLQKAESKLLRSVLRS
ncbi:DNA-binding protein [Halobiforma lacisalsi AJ5]|uniref:DNA-binding protein n=2 Tax=Natronobacterium TaxID=2256 RepID=M0LMY3_NATLA|nr:MULTISPECIES: helix-turn-helix domain-containing protein [Halobiforma]APW96837.1 DNA-binding protein [Halobiforma lacisalsi AJ5]EMA34866.1 DNA binding protein [Halobiforma lacisalsi AJ5]SFC65921.1 Predicted DNA binding protein, contains HTH domain [Halobiforma haloterrestris]